MRRDPAILLDEMMLDLDGRPQVDRVRLTNHNRFMTSYTVQVAKTHLSRILRDVEAGEEVTITRGDHPVARLTPVDARPRRQFGGLEIEIPDDFDAPMSEEELALWE